MKRDDVKDIRAKLGMTQQELATALGVWLVTVQRWEQARTKVPSGTQLALRLLLEKKQRAD